MTPIPILQKESPELRRISVPVPVADIASPHIQGIIARMKEALASQDDGVAIAAPQIGENLRIFVVSGKTLAMLAEEKKSGTSIHDQHTAQGDNPHFEPLPDMVCINPEIVKQSKTTEWMEEGCLSVRYLYGRVKRAKKITIQAHNERGELFTRGGSGLLAQIFQHETDHLDGVLFIDKAEDVEDVPPEPERAE